jgi:hypothetical protein
VATSVSFRSRDSDMGERRLEQIIGSSPALESVLAEVRRANRFQIQVRKGVRMPWFGGARLVASEVATVGNLPAMHQSGG